MSKSRLKVFLLIHVFCCCPGTKVAFIKGLEAFQGLCPHGEMGDMHISVALLYGEDDVPWPIVAPASEQGQLCGASGLPRLTRRGLLSLQEFFRHDREER